MPPEAPPGSSSAPTPARRRGAFALWLVLAAVVFVLDQVTKHAVLAYFREGANLPITSFFSLVLAFNPGAAFSFLAGAGGWQRELFSAVAVAASILIVYLLWKHADERLFSFGLALILGGALGNLYDRVTLGKVVDFLLFHYAGWHWPAFNLADSAITVGAAALILDSFVGRRRPAAAAPSEKA
jgi:signal peptidase II